MSAAGGNDHSTGKSNCHSCSKVKTTPVYHLVVPNTTYPTACAAEYNLIPTTSATTPTLYGPFDPESAVNQRTGRPCIQHAVSVTGRPHTGRQHVYLWMCGAHIGCWPSPLPKTVADLSLCKHYSSGAGPKPPMTAPLWQIYNLASPFASLLNDGNAVAEARAVSQGCSRKSAPKKR